MLPDLETWDVVSAATQRSGSSPAQFTLRFQPKCTEGGMRRGKEGGLGDGLGQMALNILNVCDIQINTLCIFLCCAFFLLCKYACTLL